MVFSLIKSVLIVKGLVPSVYSVAGSSCLYLAKTLSVYLKGKNRKENAELGAKEARKINRDFRHLGIGRWWRAPNFFDELFKVWQGYQQSGVCVGAHIKLNRLVELPQFFVGQWVGIVFDISTSNKI